MKTQGTILVVEDNQFLNKASCRILKMNQYDVISAPDLQTAREMLEIYDPNVILLDVMLPDGNGFDFCQEIQKTFSGHVIFLTALASHEHIAKGYMSGGDNYITKPFMPDELLVKVGAAIRRQQKNFEMSTIKKGPITLNLTESTAYIHGKDLNLTSKEFNLLLYLVQADGVISTTSLYRKVWKQQLGEDTAAVKTMISRLRGKLASSGYTISAKRGKGYQLEHH